MIVEECTTLLCTTTRTIVTEPVEFFKPSSIYDYSDSITDQFVRKGKQYIYAALLAPELLHFFRQKVFQSDIQ